MCVFQRELGCANAIKRTDLEDEVTDRLVREKNYTAYARIAIAMMPEDVVSTELEKRLVSSVYPQGDPALPRQALRDRSAVQQQNIVD
jgi:hypothetical protein